MGKKLIRWLWLAASYIAIGLLENIIFGWADEKIISALGITDTTITGVMEKVWTFGLPALTTFILFLGYHYWYSRFGVEKKTVGSPEQETETEIPTSNRTQPTFISMHEAATRLYESQASIAGTRLSVAAEKLGNLTLGAASPNERLDYLAHFISRKLDVYGSKPPSRLVGKIDGAEVRRASFRDGANVLRDNMYDQSIFWVDLCVKADDVNELIRSLTESNLAQRESDEAAFEKAFYRASMLNGSRDDAKLLIAKLRGEGIIIRNHPQIVDHLFTNELDKWIASVIDWMNEVIEAIESFDAADAEWFRTLGEVPNSRVGIPNIRLDGKAERERYIKAFREHDFRLARLDKLLSKYGIGG